MLAQCVNAFLWIAAPACSQLALPLLFALVALPSVCPFPPGCFRGGYECCSCSCPSLFLLPSAPETSRLPSFGLPLPQGYFYI